MQQKSIFIHVHRSEIDRVLITGDRLYLEPINRIRATNLDILTPEELIRTINIEEKSNLSYNVPDCISGCIRNGVNNVISK